MIATEQQTRDVYSTIYYTYMNDSIKNNKNTKPVLSSHQSFKFKSLYIPNPNK